MKWLCRTSVMFAVGAAIGITMILLISGNWNSWRLQAQPSSKAASVDPWQLLVRFSQDADGGLHFWSPRCTVIPVDCGAASVLGAAAVIEDRSVWFNATATSYLQNISNAMQAGGPPPAAIYFPYGSSIARLEWAVVKGGAGRSTGRVAIPLYNPVTTILNPHLPLAGSFARITRLEVDFSVDSCPSGPLVTPVPIGCFFRVDVTPKNVNRLKSDRSNVGSGDRLILLGFHLILKSNHGWTFSTFWWQNQPVLGKPGMPCDAIQNLCSALSPRWRHYLMDVVRPAKNAQIVPVMNPYLEGGLPNNTNLNCAVCHAYAAVPRDLSVFGGNLGGSGPTTIAAFQASRNKYMNGRVATDNIWSVARAFVGNSGDSLSDFQ